MKTLNFYSDVLDLHNSDSIFQYILDNLKPSNTHWSYFVNWDKVFENNRKIELSLNVLNYLIGKEDFEKEFRFLLKENPQVVSALPSLVVRGGDITSKIQVLVDYSSKKLVYKEFDFSKKELTNNDVESYLEFVTETGFRSLIENKKIKCLVDYMIGVEAGLDSNGRKNRGGHIMEEIIEIFVKDVCSRLGYRYLKEANADKIQAEFGYSVPVDKSSRRYDYVIDNGKELFIFETNFYCGGGSKLKSTAGEYRNLYDVLDGKYKFIWITDGKGWLSTTRPLRETFDHNDYIFTLAMLEKDILDYILTNNA